MTTKKALTVLGMVGFLFMLTFIVPARLVGLDDTPKKKKRDPLVLKTYQELKQLDGDKDGNGIPDWKDVINATMSTSTKQTVGTKTLDEATRKRLEDPNNLTVSFSKNIYIASAYAEKQGNLTKEQKEELVQTVLEGERVKLTRKEYTVDDLTLIKDESPLFIKSYGNNLGTIYSEALKANATQNDLAILKAYEESKDKTLLTGFVVKKNIILKAVNELATMRVPYSATPLHLEVLNKLSEYYAILDNLSVADSDPLRSALAFNAYKDNMVSMHSAFIALNNYFVFKQITFSKSDSGFSVFSEYTQ